MKRRSGAFRQRGQAMLEYIYVLPILLLLVLGAIQFGFIFQAKSTLNYATFVATREGALNNGSMSKISEGLTAGMLPLFAHSQLSANQRDLKLLKTAWRYASADVNNPKLTQITIVNPTPIALGVFRTSSESGDEIPNDNLMYRPVDIMGGDMNIQDANLLKVRVTYCFRMAVPLLNRLIYNLAVDTPAVAASTGTGTGTAATDMLDSHGGASTSKPCTENPGDYRIPVTAEAVVRMQTPFRDPGKWVGP
jgi:hypothetical protein